MCCQLNIMKTILVPTDFSPNAARAIDYAVQLARKNNAALLLVHACDHIDNLGLEAGFPKAAYNKQVADEAFANLEVIRQSIEDTEKITVKTELYGGPVVDTVLAAAEEYQPDIIIMGTMGITSLRDRIFGTNTSAVIKRSAVPVLAIPLEYDWRIPKCLLLAVNKLEEATNKTQPLFELAAAFGAEVQLVVFTDESSAEVVDFAGDENTIRQAEEELQKKYPGLTIRAVHLGGRYFEESINDYITSIGADMLAMITHKRTFLESLFNRSLTRMMSYHAHVPVFAIPVTG